VGFVKRQIGPTKALRIGCLIYFFAGKSKGGHNQHSAKDRQFVHPHLPSKITDKSVLSEFGQVYLALAIKKFAKDK